VETLPDGTLPTPLPLLPASLEKPRSSARRAHPISMVLVRVEQRVGDPDPDVHGRLPRARRRSRVHHLAGALPAVCRYRTEAVAPIGQRNVAHWPTSKQVPPWRHSVVAGR
jgi:hypothetical protein